MQDVILICHQLHLANEPIAFGYESHKANFRFLKILDLHLRVRGILNQVYNGTQKFLDKNVMELASVNNRTVLNTNNKKSPINQQSFHDW